MQPPALSRQCRVSVCRLLLMFLLPLLLLRRPVNTAYQLEYHRDFDHDDEWGDCGEKHGSRLLVTNSQHTTIETTSVPFAVRAMNHALTLTSRVYVTIICLRIYCVNQVMEEVCPFLSTPADPSGLLSSRKSVTQPQTAIQLFVRANLKTERGLMKLLCN
jgi:hypothetical protein